MHHLKKNLKSTGAQNFTQVRFAITDLSVHYAYTCDLHDLDFCWGK